MYINFIKFVNIQFILIIKNVVCLHLLLQKLYRFINCVELVSPHHAARELVNTIRQGHFTSLFQKSVKRVRLVLIKYFKIITLFSVKYL